MKPIKPRKMWAQIDPKPIKIVATDEKLWIRSRHDTIPEYVPVTVYFRDAASVEAMAVKLAEAQVDRIGGQWDELYAAQKWTCIQEAMKDLKVLGLVPVRGKGQK